LIKLRSSHSRRIRIPVRGSTSSKPSKPPDKLQHGNDRLPKKRKDRR
jgi:hypothetical protein